MPGGDAGVHIVVGERREWLQIEISGVGGTLEGATASWTRMLAEVERSGMKRLLVIDRMHGEKTLGPADFEQLNKTVLWRFPPGVRVAFVVRDARLIPQIEHGALIGRGSGIQISLFDDLERAATWLRYGEA